MWGLSLYCCDSGAIRRYIHRCYTAEQRLITTLTITTSAAMSVLRALVLDWVDKRNPQIKFDDKQNKKENVEHCLLDLFE